MKHDLARFIGTGPRWSRIGGVRPRPRPPSVVRLLLCFTSLPQPLAAWHTSFFASRPASIRTCPDPQAHRQMGSLADIFEVVDDLIGFDFRSPFNFFRKIERCFSEIHTESLLKTIFDVILGLFLAGGDGLFARPADHLVPNSAAVRISEVAGNIAGDQNDICTNPFLVRKSDLRRLSASTPRAGLAVFGGTSAVSFGLGSLAPNERLASEALANSVFFFEAPKFATDCARPLKTVTRAG